jgi:hypothetical protein
MNMSGSVLTLKKIAIAHISGWLNVYGQFKIKKCMHEPNLVFYLLLKKYHKNIWLFENIWSI